MRVYVDQKGNGFVVSGYGAEGSTATKELVVEGDNPSRLGAAVMAMFRTPRKPRAKKEESA